MCIQLDVLFNIHFSSVTITNNHRSVTMTSNAKKANACKTCVIPHCKFLRAYNLNYGNQARESMCQWDLARGLKVGF